MRQAKKSNCLGCGSGLSLVLSRSPGAWDPPYSVVSTASQGMPMPLRIMIEAAIT